VARAKRKLNIKKLQGKGIKKCSVVVNRHCPLEACKDGERGKAIMRSGREARLLKHAVNRLVPAIGLSLVNPFFRGRKTCFHGVIVGLELLIHWESHEYILKAFAVVNV
jgi:hypothetical protein